MITAVVSADGFVADDDDAVGPLFDWYSNGDVALRLGDPDRAFHVSAASAGYIRDEWKDVGVVVIGRRLFAITNGWGGVPATGEHVVVVTHEPPTDWPFPDAPFTFVTDGVAAAIEKARAIAGDRDVTVTGGDIGGQALATGLVDEVHMSVVPVVFGSGRRFFGSYDSGHVMLENPRVVQGDRVTHLAYPVRTRITSGGSSL